MRYATASVSKLFKRPVFALCNRFQAPYPTSRQNPILGRQRILSAITNPTGKKRLDAGMYGKTANEMPNNKIFCLCLLPARPYVANNVTVTNVTNVRRLCGSKSDVITGAAPNLQSAERREGFNNSHKFMKERCIQLSWRQGDSSAVGGFTYLSRRRQ